MPRKLHNRPIRAPEFGVRFRRACDESPNCPPKHDGRYVWIVGEYLHSQGDKISNETCRKWHEGEVQPRRNKIPALAKILGVNPVWLETGAGSPKGYEIPDSQFVAPRIPTYKFLTGDKNQRQSVPIAIRPNVTIEITNLPLDLSHSEAKRVANIVLAYAVGE